MQYITIEEAQLYFDTRLHIDSWTAATSVDKDKALIMATRIINGFNYYGDKYSSTQENEFPRGDSDTVPTDIKSACVEIALRLLDDVDPDVEIEASNVQSSAFATIKTTYDRSFVPEHLVVGVPSATAWKLMTPYLRDVSSIAVNRAT
jgi:hypothetical protein